MSSNVAYAGFSLKLNEDLQTEDSLKEVAKSFGFEWEDNDDWDDIMYGEENYQNRWKPHMDYNGKYGFIWVIHYEYDAYDIIYKQPITALGKALKDFIQRSVKPTHRNVGGM